MTRNWDTRTQRHRLLGLMAVVGLHTLIAAAWLADRPVAPEKQIGVPRIQWLRLTPPEAHAYAPPPQQTKSPTALRLPRLASSAPTDTSRAALPKPGRSNSDAMQSQAPMTEATPSKQTGTEASDLLIQARQIAGRVDQQLRREHAEQIQVLTATPNTRFLADLQSATVRKWTGIANVTETTMPGTGERLYKISNGTDTYCVRIPSPSVGIDKYEWERNNYHPITCPR